MIRTVHMFYKQKIFFMKINSSIKCKKMAICIIYMTAEKIKGADFIHRIKFVLLVY
jgi:hypothetical protein